MNSRLRCLYARKSRRCPAAYVGGGDASAGAELSAVQLPGLRAAGAHLPTLRPRQPVLRRAVCAPAPARVDASNRRALSAELPRRVLPRGTSAQLARTASAES